MVNSRQKIDAACGLTESPAYFATASRKPGKPYNSRQAAAYNWGAYPTLRVRSTWREFPPLVARLTSDEFKQFALARKLSNAHAASATYNPDIVYLSDIRREHRNMVLPIIDKYVDRANDEVLAHVEPIGSATKSKRSMIDAKFKASVPSLSAFYQAVDGLTMYGASPTNLRNAYFQKSGHDSVIEWRLEANGYLHAFYIVGPMELQQAVLRKLSRLSIET